MAAECVVINGNYHKDTFQFTSTYSSKQKTQFVKWNMKIGGLAFTGKAFCMQHKEETVCRVDDDGGVFKIKNNHVYISYLTLGNPEKIDVVNFTDRQWRKIRSRKCSSSFQK